MEAVSKTDDTEKMAKALEVAGRAYGKHSGPQSDEQERRTFASDLHRAALRYARAYYSEAREFGLIPEYVRVPSKPCGISGMWRGNVEGECENCRCSYGAHGRDDSCPVLERRS